MHKHKSSAISQTSSLEATLPESEYYDTKALKNYYNLGKISYVRHSQVKNSSVGSTF